jgi:diketogulonate reductase-like aldo/keto reductase
MPLSSPTRATVFPGAGTPAGYDRGEMDRTRVVQGVTVPAFLYGTAWKEAKTPDLVALALDAGFQGLDTANQRRHYFEAGVGVAVAAHLARGGRTREDLFLQTKFTSVDGQDHRLPYDRGADPAAQVRQSFASSLEHLRTTYLDSYVLHGPSSSRGITAEDWVVWRAMEERHRAGEARLLGISNLSLGQLVTLYEGSGVKPAFVQNRCFAATAWDRETRAFCTERGILYQGFSLLTANPRALASPAVAAAARRTGRSPEQVVFRFALQAGMVPLTGTSSRAHMEADLAAFDFALEHDEVDAIETCAVGRG